MLHHTMMGEQKLRRVGHCLKADGLGWRTEGQILAIFPDLMRNFCPNRLKISQCQLEGKSINEFSLILLYLLVSNNSNVVLDNILVQRV